MKLYFLNTLSFVMLFCSISFGQAQKQGQATTANQLKKAVVKIESIQQRYDLAQVEALLHKQIDTIKGLSQHDTYARQDALLNIKDTIRGTGLMIADGPKIYLVTAKHIIKATEKLSNGLETINDLLSIKTDDGDKKTNDISLMNLATTTVNNRPFMFSPDQDDLAVISFQKDDYKVIVTYMKQNGCVPIPIQSIAQMDNYNAGDDVFAVGFPALGGSKSSVVSNGKIASITQSQHNYIANLIVYPGNSGGPVIAGNKLIGILSYQTGMQTNIDAAAHPYEKANSAMVIKAANILPLLRKLQQNERNAGFK